ncbi:prepilin peptidase, partial [Komagataeibacter saccharivorans]
RYIRGREGLGQGDAKLLAAAGAWIGYEQLPLVIAGGSIVTLLAIGIMQMTRPVTHMPDDALPARIPFGPGLALALWVLFLFGPAPWGTS